MEIFAENIRAIQAIYSAALLEEMRVFAVADRIVEQFVTGLLPLGSGPAGERLYQYWKGHPNRLEEAARRQIYLRAVGLGPGGDSDPTANREFEDLWLRFVSAVSQLARQGEPSALETARAARLDLAVNLSLHGSCGTAFAAARLAEEVREAVGLLSEEEVRQAYGAQDLWQLIERVNHLYLGAASNVSRQRTRLEAGHRIFEWLADSAAVPEPDLADPSLVNAVEAWLAVSGETERWSPQDEDIRAESLRQIETLFSRSQAASELPPEIRTRLMRDAAEIGTAIVKARGDQAVAGDLLGQVDFPQFVAGLIEGVFNAVVDSSVRQMEAYADLVASVASSVDRFVADTQHEPDHPGREGLSTLMEALLAGTTRIVISDGRACRFRPSSFVVPVEAGSPTSQPRGDHDAIHDADDPQGL
jgi:hypothetical protein